MKVKITNLEWGECVLDSPEVSREQLPKELIYDTQFFMEDGTTENDFEDEEDLESFLEVCIPDYLYDKFGYEVDTYNMKIVE